MAIPVQCACSNSNSFFYTNPETFHSVAGNAVTALWLTGFPTNYQQVRNLVLGSDIHFKEYVVCSKVSQIIQFR